MKKQVPQHNHKYERVIIGGRRVLRYTDELGRRKRKIEKTGGYEVYRCVFPNCGKQFPVEIAAGNTSLCWQCNEELLLTKENLKLKRPTHLGCRKIRLKISAA